MTISGEKIQENQELADRINLALQIMNRRRKGILTEPEFAEIWNLLNIFQDAAMPSLTDEEVRILEDDAGLKKLYERGVVSFSEVARVVRGN